MSGYKTACPQCYGRNYYVTPHNGKKYCFNCGHFENDGVYIAPTRAPDIVSFRKLYTELADYYHGCLDDTHRAYLHARGINDTSIERFKIGYVPNDTHILYRDPVAVESGIARRDHDAFLGNRIVFPYITHGVVTDFRGRFIGDHPIKYLSPKGSAYYRGADYAFNHDTLEHNEVVITEGDPKAAMSEQSGVPAISIPGILSLRPAVRQRDNQTFIACFDSQVEHWYDVVRAIQRLARNFERLRVATLPLLGHDKMDIDTFILLKGADAYKKVISRAVPYTTWIRMIRP